MQIYGFTKETSQSKDQQAQAQEEAACQPAQEAHLAEVSPGLAARLASIIHLRLRRFVRDAAARWKLRFPYDAAALVCLALLIPGCTTLREKADQKQNERIALEELIEQELLDQKARAIAHYATGLILESNDESQEAAGHFSESVLNDPSNEALALDLARRQIIAKEPEKALEILNKAASAPDASAAVFAWLGLVNTELTKNEDAIKACRTAIRKDPLQILAYQSLTQSYLQSNRPKEALKAMDEAARTKDADGEFLLQVAQMFTTYNRLQPRDSAAVKPRIAATLEAAERKSEKNSQARQRIADGFSEIGAFDKAEVIYNSLLKETPPIPGLRERLLQNYLRAGKKDEAAKQMQSLARENPTNPEAFFFLGTVAAEQKKYKEAADYFEKVRILKPDFEPVYYELAGLKIGENQPGEALDILDKARTLFRKSFFLELYTGIALGNLKQYESAIKHFTEAESLGKSAGNSVLTASFYFQYGSVYERAGNLEEAERLFRKCLEMKPDFAEALNYLGYMWAEKGLKLEEARKMIDLALKAEPDNAAYLDSMAWVLFKLGKSSEALKFIQKAVAKTEKPDATLYDHLGDILTKLNQTEPAKAAWKQSLEIEENPAIKAKLDAPSTKPAGKP